MAKRCQHLSEEIADADAQPRALITRTAPGLLALPGVSTQTAGQLLVTAGDNPDRPVSEASFAHLCAAAPMPAAPTATDSTAAATARPTVHRTRSCWSVCDPRTRDYVARRTLEGLKTKDILRCLKRFVARKVYHHLTSAFRSRPSASPAT